MKFSTLVQIARMPPSSKRRTVSEPGPGDRPSTPQASPPASPRKEKAGAEPSTVRSCSGDAPKTHECLLDAGEDAIERVARLVHNDEFVLDPQGGVQSQRLLALTRRELVTKAQFVGANALVDEECVPSPSRSRRCC